MTEKIHRQMSSADYIERTRTLFEQFLRDNTTIDSCGTKLAERGSPLMKAFAIAGILIQAIPGARKAIVESLRRKPDFSDSPINLETYEIKDRIALGYITEVYMLASKREDIPNRVYKIEYPTTRRDVDYYVRLAQQYRSEYEAFKKVYAALPEFVVDTHYIVANSPRTRVPAVGVIQEFVGTERFDPLLKHNHEKLMAIFAAEPEFKEEFMTFKEITLKLQETKRAPDIAGHNNVLVVKTGDRHGLRLVDPHGFSEDNHIAYAVQAKSIEYLKTIV